MGQILPRLALLLPLALGACTWGDAAVIGINDPSAPADALKAVSSPWTSNAKELGSLRYCQAADGARFFTYGDCGNAAEISESDYRR